MNHQQGRAPGKETLSRFLLFVRIACFVFSSERTSDPIRGVCEKVILFCLGGFLSVV